MNIKEYIEKVREHCPCRESLDTLDACSTEEGMYDLANTPMMCEYLLDSNQRGWGASSEDIAKAFASYTNGKRTVTVPTKKRNIVSQMWTGTIDFNLDPSVNQIVLIGYDGYIRIPDYRAVVAYVDKTTKVTFCGGKGSVVRVRNYGGSVRTEGVALRKREN